MHHDESFFAEPRNWVVLAFLLFFILFGKKLWGALAGILDARAVAVKAELEEASRLRREAEAMLRDAEKQRADALADAKALIEGARTEAGRLAPPPRPKPRRLPSAASKWRSTGSPPPRRPPSMMSVSPPPISRPWPRDRCWPKV